MRSSKATNRRSRHCSGPTRCRDAIIDFNRANTDSQDVPTHTEVVMTKSAFEFLLGIGEKKDELVRPLNEVDPIPASYTPH
jgi:hypothetical protein